MRPAEHDVLETLADDGALRGLSVGEVMRDGHDQIAALLDAGVSALEIVQTLEERHGFVRRCVAELGGVPASLLARKAAPRRAEVVGAQVFRRAV